MRTHWDHSTVSRAFNDCYPLEASDHFVREALAQCSEATTDSCLCEARWYGLIQVNILVQTRHSIVILYLIMHDKLDDDDDDDDDEQEILE